MINLTDVELYVLMFLILGCSIGNAIYCICCLNNNRYYPIQEL